MSGTSVLLERQGSVAEPQQWYCIQTAIRMRGTLSSCAQQLSVHEQKMGNVEVASIHSAIWLHGSQVLKKQHKQYFINNMGLLESQQKQEAFHCFNI
jgi:hypothetical protein